MKIKHKWLGVELTVQNESVFIPRFFGRFYETVGGSLIAHDDNDWQLVKEEEWEDVTGGCEIGRFGSDEFVVSTGLNNYVHMTDTARSGVNVLATMSYRLRKIDGPHNGPCFIVERRKS